MATATKNTVLDAPVLVHAGRLSAATLAGLHVAAKRFDAAAREQLAVGEHTVYARVLLAGGVKVGAPTVATGAPDYQGVLAWVLSRLPARQREAVAAAVAAGISVDDVDRVAAREICRPTAKEYSRSGSVSGVVRAEEIQ